MKIPTLCIFAALTVDASAEFGQFMEQKRNVQLTNGASDRAHNVKQKLYTAEVALIQERIVAMERNFTQMKEEELRRKGRFSSATVSTT